MGEGQTIQGIIGGILAIGGLLLAISGGDLWGRKLKWSIGLGFALSGVGLFMLITSFPQYAIGFSVLATLALAFAAFLTIKEADAREQRHRNNDLLKEKRDKDERLLNEIIEWALDISNCRGNPFHTESDKIRDEWSAKIVDTFSLEERFYDLENRGKYIQQIALKLEKGLGSAVGEVMSDIKGRRMQLIDSMGTRPTHDLDMDEMRKIIDIQSGKVETLDGLSEHAKKSLALGKSAGKLRKSVSKLIEEATEIKTRDIS